MRVEIDTHTHTLASGHAYNTMNEMAKAAADKGFYHQSERFTQNNLHYLMKPAKKSQ